MKKYIYAGIASVILTSGIYTAYGDYRDSFQAKSNLSIMNKSHLFVSTINTEDNREEYRNVAIKSKIETKKTAKVSKDTSSKSKISQKSKSKSNVTTNKNSTVKKFAKAPTSKIKKKGSN